MGAIYNRLNEALRETIDEDETNKINNAKKMLLCEVGLVVFAFLTPVDHCKVYQACSQRENPLWSLEERISCCLCLQRCNPSVSSSSNICSLWERRSTDFWLEIRLLLPTRQTNTSKFRLLMKWRRISKTLFFLLLSVKLNVSFLTWCRREWTSLHVLPPYYCLFHAWNRDQATCLEKVEARATGKSQIRTRNHAFKHSRDSYED